ncbi:30S ribosomal protein S9 [Gracilinema caldarium]|uniref:Small ribosomal subunit protein uS9 n=1 Tax=Gracilinema caldarium (strain ATCC 51460 / DSM 7334 / H1) TaxID=744872 RepID=F8EYQ5_GRAC1|nr:30S ribosomal protein S9 [Gracilinema caldarium]AEJ18632.1 ribosomal protein S9 [Gracilinema caldarium DSM 7334]
MIKNLGIGTGRRKTAVARVFVRDGSGKIVVNGKELNQYFTLSEHALMVRQPLMVTASENKYDILINVYGGGPNGQAGACRHGLARALCQVDHTNYTSLRTNGYLTRDPRMVERKKYGQAGARRRFQFSKR